MHNEYFEWLLNRAGVSNGERDYSILCSILHEVIFYPVVEMDADRWEDGVRYRWMFAMEKTGDIQEKADLIADHLDGKLGGCTVLELILSLAERISFEMSDSQFEAGPGKWFEEMIGNLGLDRYTNHEMMEDQAAYFEVDRIAENLIFRRYGYSGEGGLFPLMNPEEDQRGVELSIQMNNYLMENYDILGG